MKKVQDHYFKKARKDNYPARSVYKLREMDKRFRLFRPGQKVLDLGASPGSWSLYAAQKVTSNGLVLAVDLKEPAVSFPGQVRFIQGDVFSDTDVAQQIRNLAPFNLVLSDMAPKTIGIKITDQARSFELAMEALHLGRLVLIPGGSLCVKIFEGPDVEQLNREMKSSFVRVKHFKPKSSRAESREIFLIGMQFQKKENHDASDLDRIRT